jgi:hypothetical protein
MSSYDHRAGSTSSFLDIDLSLERPCLMAAGMWRPEISYRRLAAQKNSINSVILLVLGIYVKDEVIFKIDGNKF